jgi:hypothetical protein
LTNVPVGDAGIRRVKTLPRLKELHLIRTRASPAVVFELGDHPKLERVKVEWNTGEFIEPLWLKTSQPKKPFFPAALQDVQFTFQAALRVDAQAPPLPTTSQCRLEGRPFSRGRQALEGRGAINLNRPGELVIDGIGGKQGEWTGKYRIQLRFELPINRVKFEFTAPFGDVEIKPGEPLEIQTKVVGPTEGASRPAGR